MRGPQRSLPTPPASTHSSSGTIRHGKSAVSLDIDINRLQAELSSYTFNRRKFADTSQEHVRFCNNILKLQRIKLKEKRLSNKWKTQQKPSESKTETTNWQKLHRLRTLNVKLRHNIDKLESAMAIITNYATEEQAKAAIIANIKAMPDPVVRLKRIHVNELLVPYSDADENTVVSAINAAIIHE